MSELIFKSSLTPEEIEENFKNVDFFSGIMDGLQEALAYSKGKATAAPTAKELMYLIQEDPALIQKL